MADQVVTITEPTNYREKAGIQKIKWDWKSATGGAIVGSVTTLKYTGVVARVETIPDGGATAPTASYDITIKNDDGVDVLSGLGADRSATATETKNIGDGLGCVLDSTLTLAVAAAGDEKGGIVILYIV